MLCCATFLVSIAHTRTTTANCKHAIVSHLVTLLTVRCYYMRMNHWRYYVLLEQIYICIYIYKTHMP